MSGRMSHCAVRQRLEEKEESLSPFAARSRCSKGRERPEEPSAVRTEFQRDRDRIIHSKAFRRLMHKTQVFIAPLGDHYVTRLTHTLEVSQIARTVSRALNLNEDLTEAISLGHDLGHTPFGHVGEEALGEVFPGFRHNEQSLRVVDVLEKDGQGLNLTWEVRDGILNHSKGRGDILADHWGIPSTLEGEVCRLADSVAYINHDIGDALRAHLITELDLPASSIAVLGSSHSERINNMVCDIIDFSWSATGAHGVSDWPVIGMSDSVLQATNTLRDFLFESVYCVGATRDDAVRAREVVRSLFVYFSKHEERLPSDYLVRGDSLSRKIVDNIAGMTDHYAVRLFEEIQFPPLWS